MTVWEGLVWVFVLLLALYGCTQAVRRLCLWLTRCPRCVQCCRLAIPRQRAELEPLVRGEGWTQQTQVRPILPQTL